MVEGEGETRVFSLRLQGREEELIKLLEEAELPSFEEPKNDYFPSEDPEGRYLLERFGQGADVLEKAKNLGAYRALERALGMGKGKGGDWALEEILASEIRGRGGAGFPAGLKLKTVKEASCTEGKKYVVCNADEGDAGAFIDKELLEQDPHAVIEGILLAALAVGAGEGVVYLRKEYPRAQRVFAQAVAEAQEGGYLGEDLLGSGFDFSLRIVGGQGAYICGEETSLLRSLEGVPAQVSPKPPFPAVSGYLGAPTLVQNVETLAAFPQIVARGGAAFAALGFGRSRGTKLVSLNSAVAKPGLYEVELGISLQELLFERAGGMADGKSFQAVQVGGPLGGIFPETLLEIRLDFEDFAAHRGLLGHAGIVVYPDDVDLVRIGRNLMAFCAVESCGKCFPCRIGSLRGTEIFDRILSGAGSQADLDLLAELDETMLYGSLCALGGAIPTPIDNLMIHFIESFQRYIPGAKTPERVFQHLEA
jgi:formate dehydrogenase iron-sulfur subunit